jgi:thiamine pyrophosphokinase
MIIGVDRGAFIASEAGLKLDVAYGDFDSVSPSELDLIAKSSKKVIQLNSVKDFTDAYGAYKLAQSADKIVILGGIQGMRVEHFLALLNIVKTDPRVEIQDNASTVKNLIAKEMPYLVDKKDGKYCSLFSNGEAKITLEGFKYPLKDYLLKENDSLCISNEVNKDSKQGRIFIESGSCLAIFSKDDHPLLLK